MPNQNIPITLAWGPTAAAWSGDDINALGALIARQLAGSIRADITFIPILTSDPAAFQGDLIFNIAQRVFKTWDTGAGAYRAVTGYAVGDVKNTFSGDDSVATGWVMLNGRKILEITGLSAIQITNLQGLFGAAADTQIPSVTPANISGLPAGNAFGNLAWPEILPIAGTFSGLAFTNPVTDTEANTFADDTEIMRTSLSGVFELVKQIQTLCQEQLNAFNTNTTPPLYAQIFCGYP